jgi:hypothetical protein
MLATTLHAQDAATIQLQQDVLELKRLNQQLERRIENLERQLGQVSGQSNLTNAGIAARGAAGATAGGVAGGPNALPSWFNSADWDRIKPGMPELDVIRILGVPNSLRDSANGRQVIYYAVEIGTARFLSGSVTLAGHQVVEVQKPTLK